MAEQRRYIKVGMNAEEKQAQADYIIGLVEGAGPRDTFNSLEELNAKYPPEEAPKDGWKGSMVVLQKVELPVPKTTAYWYIFDNNSVPKQWKLGGEYVGNLEGYAKIDGSYDGMTVGVAKTLPASGVIQESLFNKRITAGGSALTDGLAQLLELKGNTIESINKIDISKIVTAYNSTELVKQQDSFSFKNIFTSSTSDVKTDKIYLKQKTYYLNGKIESEDGKVGGFSVHNEKGQLLFNFSSSGLNHPFSIAQEGYYTIHFYANYGSIAGTKFTYSNVILSDEDRNYIRYFDGLKSSNPETINSINRNYINYNDIELDINSTNLVVNKNSFSFEKVNPRQDGTISMRLYLPKGKYHMQGKSSQSDGLKSGFIIIVPGTGEYVINNASRGVNADFTIKNDDYYKITFTSAYASPSGTVTTFENVMLSYDFGEKEFELNYSVSIPTNYADIFGDKLKELRGIDEDNCDSINKEFATRKLNVVDLGDLNWVDYEQNSFYAVSPTDSADNTELGIPAKIAGYINARGFASIDRAYAVNCGASPDRVIFLRDERYSSASEFKQAIKGTKMIYLMKEFVVKPNPQPNIRFMAYFNGFEEWLAEPKPTIPVPVLTKIEYLPDQAKKLELLPTREEYNSVIEDLTKRIIALETQRNERGQ